MTKTHLLIIDPQNDFCDLPPAYCPLDPQGSRPAPALPVKGAHQDMLRLAALIDRSAGGLDAISVTLDSHHRLDIAHSTYWQDAAGKPVAPFTPITAADLRAGRYTPRDPSLSQTARSYLEALERGARRTHMVWPVHCQIGGWGHNIHHDLRLALARWEETHIANVAMVSKGENPATEHYSALQAEVPDPNDPATQLNTALIDRLRCAERIYIAGEAGSHCVKATVEHLVAHWAPGQLRRLALIEDCISPVAGFEAAYAEFVVAMREQGLDILSASQVDAELRKHSN